MGPRGSIPCFPPPPPPPPPLLSMGPGMDEMWQGRDLNFRARSLPYWPPPHSQFASEAYILYDLVGAHHPSDDREPQSFLKLWRIKGGFHGTHGTQMAAFENTMRKRTTIDSGVIATSSALCGFAEFFLLSYR